MTTLYRKYRPEKFSDIIGQPQVTKTLEKAIKQDQVAHAYLFQGPRGTGKTTSARVLASSLNCQAPNLIEIDAASNRGIDDIRNLQEGISTKPTQGEFKIYIIDEVHMLTKEAFTALLKTLEEPQSHVIFILATTELHKVPATILSRCQVFRFRRGTNDEVTSRLKDILKREKRAAENDAIDFIVDRADGCYRDAESLLGQALATTDKKLNVADLTGLLGVPAPEMIIRWLTALLDEDASQAVTVVDEAIAAGFDPEALLAESIRKARDDAIAQAKSGEGSERWSQVIRTLIQAQQDLAYVPQPQIALHLAIVTLCTKKQSTQVTRPEIKPAMNFATSEPKKKSPEKVASLNQSTADLEKKWNNLIDAVKKTNPVASTFLRAMEPTNISDGVVSIKAYYSLHRNFFEKEDNKKLVEEELSKVLEATVNAKFILEVENKDGASELMKTVQEVFGDKK